MKMYKALFAVIMILSLFGGNSLAQKLRKGIWKEAPVKAGIAKQFPMEAVKIDRFEARSDGDKVVLEWNSPDNPNSLGFNIYRIHGDSKIQLNSSLIAGPSMVIPGKNPNGAYRWLDNDGDMGSGYYLESMDISGKSAWQGPVYPRQVYEIDGKEISNSALSSADLNSYTENSYPQLPAELIPAEKTRKELQLSRETQADLSAMGGAKIGIKQEGFYRVTRAQLQAAGFDVNSPSNLWQLFVDGAEQAIIVEPGGNYIEFFGRGADTIYTDIKNYYLIAGSQPGKRIQSVFRRTIRDSIIAKNFSNIAERKDNGGVYYNLILNGEADNFFGGSFNDTGVNLNVNLPDADPNGGAATIEATVQGSTLVAHTVRVLLNGTDIGAIQGNNRDSLRNVFVVPASLLLNGNNVVRLVGSASNDYCLSDTIRITYPRRYAASQNKLNFYVPNYMQTRVTGFASPSLRIFDISNPDTVNLLDNINIIPENGGHTAVIPSNRTRNLYAVEDSAIAAPFSVLPNASSNLASPSRQANMLIITHANFMSQANTWANYRRGQGMLVEVIDVEDIYDEFDFGSNGPKAIKNFLQYATSNWATAPGYVMLLGDSVFDARDYLGFHLANYVPAMHVDTTYSEVGSDEALADFNDDGLSEISIGRIPAKTPTEATLIYNKVVSFEITRNAALSRGFICVSDDPVGYDFHGICVRLGAVIPNTVPKVLVNKGDVNSRATMLTNFNSGKFLINWSGHGSSAFWSNASFFHSSDLPPMTNSNGLAIYTLLTCLNGWYNSSYSDGLAETALKSPNAAVASWASSGLTTPDVQEAMAARFYTKVGTNAIERLGDLVKDAKIAVPYGRDVRLSWVLLGDPSMKVY